MSKYANYLFDLGFLIKERAFQARSDCKAAPPDSPEREFHSGRVMAYIEVISLMQQQAEGFEIPLTELRLDGIDPDNDLF